MIDLQTGLLVGRQVAPNGAYICYGILSCYKQVAPDGAHACPRETCPREYGERGIDKFFKRPN